MRWVCFRDVANRLWILLQAGGAQRSSTLLQLAARTPVKTFGHNAAPAAPYEYWYSSYMQL
eukprot:COSAG01_NODE_6172_length_3811_cov_11.543912_6_plen_61_part_00